jgi:hypothetical protein
MLNLKTFVYVLLLLKDNEIHAKHQYGILRIDLDKF